VVAVDACANDPALSYPLATVEDLESLGRHTDAGVALRGDVRERGDLEHAVAVALERFGRIDAGVACAGLSNGAARSGNSTTPPTPPSWRSTSAASGTSPRR